MIKVMPAKVGYGFFMDQFDPNLQGYNYNNIGIYHNYHFTLDNYDWPVSVQYPINIKIDGFSPNLNKQLHIGHLRNFCVANALKKITGAKMFAMLGASLGVVEEYKQELFDLFTEHDYKCHIFYDNSLFEPSLTFKEFEDGHMEYNSIVMIKSNGQYTYAYHDLAFAEHVGPDYYVTGVEQQDHFASLGLGDKHLQMGLVLGSDNKKIKSRNGDSLLLTEALSLIGDNLNETPNKDKIAWNIACFNLLSASRSTNVKFDLDNWINPATGGLYITYTYARLNKALDSYEDKEQLEEEHIPLLGMSNYLTTYHQQAIDKFDPAPIAQYALTLSKMINSQYASDNKIKGGHPGYVYAMNQMKQSLETCMQLLGMYTIDSV